MATGNAAATLPISGGVAAFYGGYPTGSAGGEVSFGGAVITHHTIISVSGLILLSGAGTAYQPTFQAALAGYVPLVGLISGTVHPVGVLAAAIQLTGQCVASAAKIGVMVGAFSMLGEVLGKVGRKGAADGSIKLGGKMVAPPHGAIAAALRVVGSITASFKKPVSATAHGVVQLTGSAVATVPPKQAQQTDEVFTQFIYVTE